MMYVSDEQAAAAGYGRQAMPTFEWVDLPVGPQPLPDWAKGLRINWMDRYHCAPSYTVKTDQRVALWPGMVYEKQGDRYLAKSDDGRARCYYHAGEPKLTELKQRQICYPVSPPDAPGTPYSKSGKWWCSQGKPSGKLWQSTYVGWATYQDDGFGGDNIPVLLTDGRWVMLRGPWHGACPPGYAEVGTSRHEALTITQDLLCLLLARYQAHCRVARVTQGKRSWIEAVRPDWDKPKSVWLAEGRGP